ncbi:F0F1 ATP synthase subunit delta [Patescibacteria group bacterium]|nr:F0F1 ATP synthase subunit delta [Patescibacteria group bacterium]
MVKKIQTLVTKSYTQGELDREKANRIATNLSRGELKNYIRGLKDYENERTVTVVIPSNKLINENEVKEQFEKAFFGKRVVIKTNPDLIVGIKIINNDLIYELSLKNTLDSLKEYLSYNE